MTDPFRQESVDTAFAELASVPSVSLYLLTRPEFRDFVSALNETVKVRKLAWLDANNHNFYRFLRRFPASNTDFKSATTK